MNDMSQQVAVEPTEMQAREWIRVLAKYREPIQVQSLFEIAVTFVPFVLFWIAAVWVMQFSYILGVLLSLGAAMFLVRLFLIQHDCGHGAFFKSKAANNWVGRVLGVLTLTPYDVWRHCHSVHHSSSGNLDKRGLGDIHTMTVAEYKDLTWGKRLKYRLYRHPLVLFGLGPAYLYLIENRLPMGLMKAGKIYWVSSMGTNLGMAAFIGLGCFFFGLVPFLTVYVVSSLAAATMGMWLFYVQHQFEVTHWDHQEEWDVHEAALYGSSHYVLPGVLRWLTANIGIHHVHHLYSRIPYYRLTQVLKDYPKLETISRRLTLMESLKSVKLHLWDEKSRRLISYREADTI